MNEVVGAYTADKAYTIADYILRFTNDSGWQDRVLMNFLQKLEHLHGQTKTHHLAALNQSEKILMQCLALALFL